MRRVHLIAVNHSFTLDLAIALKEKGYDITGSDEHISEENKCKLQAFGIEYSSGWDPDKITRKIECVVPSAHIKSDNPEMLQAKDLNLQIMTIPEFIYDRTKSMTRVVVTGSKGKRSLLSIIVHVLRKQKVSFDCILSNKIIGLNKNVDLTNNARIVIIEGDESISSPIRKKNKLEFYRPHIVLIPNIIWKESDTYPDEESYIKTFRDFVATIERDGKFIYNGQDKKLEEISHTIREDITGIPYTAHTIVSNEGERFLDTRFGLFPIAEEDPYFLENVNGARYVCRQLGVQDKDFYAIVSEMSLQMS